MGPNRCQQGATRCILWGWCHNGAMLVPNGCHVGASRVPPGAKNKVYFLLIVRPIMGNHLACVFG